MEADVSQDFQDYWNEYRIVASDEKLLDDDLSKQPKSDDEGLDEAEWLVLAGLPHLTDSYLRGQEIEEEELEPVINVLSLKQADAVLKRVKSLNQTVKHRSKFKSKKPDIREVFKNIEDYKPIDRNDRCKEVNKSTRNDDSGYQPYCSLPDSINISSSSPSSAVDGKSSKDQNISYVTPRKEIFRRIVRPDKDIIASANADGITMLAFQRLGTLRDSKPWKVNHQEPAVLGSAERNLSESLSEDISEHTDKEESQPFASIGFEQLWQQPTNWKNKIDNDETEKNEEETVLGCTWIDTLSEDDVIKLRPLLFVELSTIFDKTSNSFPKIKQHKRKRKPEVNIFGVSLSTLMEKDAALINERNRSGVPMIFRKILNEIEKRGLREEGVLRVAGNKAKIDALCQSIEKDFYLNMQQIDQTLQRSAIHDLTAIFKKLLRDLPEPILTNELINLFYQSHYLPECEKVLNLLVLLLPVENRLTLLAILSFMRKLVEHEDMNKMSKHNVAMILAPSIFPPRYIQLEKNSTGGNLQAQIGLAAVSCRITETLMSCYERLNIVPCSLISQLRNINDLEKYRLKENNPMKKMLGRKGMRGEIIVRKIDNEVDFQEGIIRVNAPQFNLSNIPITLHDDTTAGDVVLRIVEIGTKTTARNINNKQIRRKDIKQRVLTELAPNGNLSCLLSTADAETALRTHFLYEIGGNIGQRRLEQTAMVASVYQLNPNTEWLIQCDHRNAVLSR